MIQMRKPTPQDIEQFRVCLQEDPDHKLQDADAWLSEPGEFMVFCDEKNNRVWVRIERVLRISLQHDPKTSKRAVARILYGGFQWLKGMARKSGFTEVICESTAQPLILFCQKWFGFAPMKDTFSTQLDPCADPQAPKSL